MKKRTITIYALGHFLVDFSCAYLLISSQPSPWLYVIYNFCAFALQMPIGLLADLTGYHQRLAVVGTALVLGAFLPFPILIRILLLGVGNACYHIGGGRETLLSDHRLTGLGIFVSPGAIGILLGTLWANISILSYIVSSTLFALIFGLLHCCPKRRIMSQSHKPHIGNCLWMFLVVLARSFVGMCMQTPWKIGIFVIFAGIASAVGKLIGGISADRFGSKWTGVLSLVISGCLFCIPNNAIAGILACLIFNMTMPVTLKGAANAIAGYEGFSFGLLTFALFLGYLPNVAGLTISPWVGAAVSIFSACILLLYRENRHD